jgi:GWxTD domain-containing protein
MITLSRWVQAPVAQALGWTLVHFVWEGVLIAAFLAALRGAGRGASSRWRYTLTCLALFAMPLAFAITLVHVWSAAPNAAAISVAGVSQHAPLLAPAPIAPLTTEPATVWDRLPWVVPFWMAGVLLFYVRSLGGWWFADRLRRKGVCPAPGEWRQRLQALANRMRVARPAALLESCLTDVPVVIGWLRPVILMPVGLLAGLPAAQVELILIHELAHIRRYDYLVNLLQSLVEGLLFYHPAVWWVSGLVRAERENCCDDEVVSLNGDARGYAAALAVLEESRWPAREPALAVTGGSLIRRIRRLLQEPEGPRVTMAPVFTAGLLLVSVAVALSAWQPNWPPAPEPQPAAPPPPQAVAKPSPLPQQETPAKPRAEKETPYRKWLNEDVAYIIEDREREAFKRLQTDEEREKFIEQFWLRRDPTPGTPQNEFKEEHYRRIAYTNVHFADGHVAGWKTDRGRIYITYGPPDEIESHPAGGSYRRPSEQGGGETSTFPFEQWRYRYIEGIGTNVIIEFVDSTRSGEYRMTMDPSEKDVSLNVPGRLSATFTSKAGATVQVSAGNWVLISIPLNAYGNHRVSVYGKITAHAGGVVQVFEDTLPGPLPAYRKGSTMQPGTYQFAFVLKDLDTGAVVNDAVEFFVK